MKQAIQKFFARVHQTLFQALVEWEIYHRIFPHLNREAEHGYPFQSKDEMVGLHIGYNLHARIDLRMIERAAARMPRAYGDAFRYIAYKDLNHRIKMYLELAEERVYLPGSDSHPVAAKA